MNYRIPFLYNQAVHHCTVALSNGYFDSEIHLLTDVDTCDKNCLWIVKEKLLVVTWSSGCILHPWSGQMLLCSHYGLYVLVAILLQLLNCYWSVQVLFPGVLFIHYCRIHASKLIFIHRVGVISGNVIFGPPLQKYWAEKQQQDQAAKEGQTGST